MSELQLNTKLRSFWSKLKYFFEDKKSVFLIVFVLVADFDTKH